MQSFTSNLFEPPHDQLVGVSASRPHTPPIDGDSNESSLGHAQFEAAEETTPKKTTARQRLNGLASFRIHSTEITFPSEGFHVSGGKADVVQATFRPDDGSDEEVVAVKKLRSHEGTDQKKFSNEFVHEVEIMAGLSHANIVELIGFVEDLQNGKAWIVLSWEPNGNVSEFLATGKWEIPERVSLIKDAFKGIKYLHTRQPPICHGDLKSLNILVSSSYRAIITDFGSARAITELEDIASNEEHDQQAQRNPTTEQAGPQIDVGAVGNRLTLTGPAWSLRWAPPEVVDGERPSLSTDVWAGGWICWEVMTDKVPFHEVNSAVAITMMVIQGEVPETREDAQLAQIIRLCSLMKDCWAFDPGARPNIAPCCAVLRWIPSLPPSGGKASDRKAPSIQLLLNIGQMHYNQADLAKATSLFQEALSLAGTAGNQSAAAKASRFLGDIYRVQSKYTQAEESYTRAQEIYTRIGDNGGRANTLDGLGDVYRLQSKFTQAEKSYTRAQEIYAHIGDDMGQANTLNGRGELYHVQSQFTQAEESYTRAQEIYARIGSDMGRANTLNGLGDLYRVQSQYTQAAESYTQAQEIYTRIGVDLGRANVQRGLGHLRWEQGRKVEAASHFAEAKKLYAQGGSTKHEERAAHWLADVSLEQNSSTT